jgi:uncharacterized protein YggE
MENNQNNESSCHCCGEWLKPKIILPILGMLLLTGIITVSILRDRIVNQPQYQVSVTGLGKVSYQPDIANVNLGVQVDKQFSAENALQQLNDKMNKVVTAIKLLGITEADIETQNYTLYPQYDYKDGISIPAGYSANQQLTVKVRKLNDNKESVSKVVAAATKAGANQVMGITFDVANLNDLKQEARLKAIADAKSKAGALAQAVGVELGDIMGWWENIVQAPGIQSYGSYSGDGKGGGAGAVSSPVLPTGTQEVIIEINLNYRIE